MALRTPAFTPEGLRNLISDLNASFQALAFPKAPLRLPAYATAALPAAADYPRCAVWVSDLSRIAVSDGAHWIRQDTGANV